MNACYIFLVSRNTFPHLILSRKPWVYVVEWLPFYTLDLISFSLLCIRLASESTEVRITGAHEDAHDIVVSSLMVHTFD